MRFTDQATRVRAPIVSGPYGNNQRDWVNATRITRPAEIQPVSSTEDVVNQQQTVTRWRMFWPEADLEATDRIEWDGQTYEIDGEVEKWKRHGVFRHAEAVLMKVDLEAG